MNSAGLVGALDTAQVRVVLCDLDGVVWLAGRAIPGAVDAVARLRDSGRRVLFVTNNSSAIVADQEQALERIGIPARGDVVTSAQAAAHLIEPGQRALVTGGPGVVEAVLARGADVVHNTAPVLDDLLATEQRQAGGDPIGRARAAVAQVEAEQAVTPFDVAVVGIDWSFDYVKLARAAAAVRAGARLVATNTDATYPTPDGLLPGSGTIVAAVERASGAVAVVAGKPHRPMGQLVAELVAPAPPSSWLMVGDRLDTDGAFAAAIGCPFALVRSGVIGPDDELPVEHDAPLAPALDVSDLAAVATALCQ